MTAIAAPLPPRFGAHFTSALPGEADEDLRSRQVLGQCWSPATPTPVAAPKVRAASREMVEQLGLDASLVDSQAFADVMGGNALFPGMRPYAMCYGGHQFGNWAGQLGDGRAINLGELTDVHGVTQVLQLKGAGPTPYSRAADGRAVLRSSIREYLCSEAMHHLGVPTTRALCLVTTGDEVVRDMFYDGHPRAEPGAIVCRVAPSFLRFGSYQLHAARDELDVLRQLVGYTLEAHFPEIAREHDGASPESVTALFETVARRTASLLVEWMRVGFVHGVMNTDNMSILGLTIDYGPYGWVDDFDPNWTPNTTDRHGRRYRFGQQPNIAMWNLAQLGNALHPLVGSIEPLQAAVDAFGDDFQRGYARMMAAKLGIGEVREDDDALFEDTLRLLSAAETDMTRFFRALPDLPLAAFSGARADEAAAREAVETSLGPVHYAPLGHTRRDALVAFCVHLAQRVGPIDEADARARRAAMNAVNPKYVLRNYLAQLAIDDAEAGDFGLVDELLDVLRQPYDEQPAAERHAALRPDWARSRAGCSMLSCSS